MSFALFLGLSIFESVRAGAAYGSIVTARAVAGLFEVKRNLGKEAKPINVLCTVVYSAQYG